MTSHTRVFSFNVLEVSVCEALNEVNLRMKALHHVLLITC